MERVEEYLEIIYDIQRNKKRLVKTGEIAKKLKVKPASVTEMLTKLQREGYVDYQPYKGVTLTKKGEEIAKRIKEYHLIFEKFLVEFVGLNKEVAHEISCKIEHIASEDAIRKICYFISQNCDLCKECEYSANSLERVDNGRFKVLAAPSYLETMGIKVGGKIEVKEGEVLIDGEKVKLSDEIKRKVIVIKDQ